MRTTVYIDGLNLYYLCLRRQPGLKWLNLHQLTVNVLDAKHAIQQVNYYMARVSGRPDPKAPARQQIYLSALSTIPIIKTHLGQFLYSEKMSYIVKPPKTDPDNYNWNTPIPKLVLIGRNEEKGSDVNLASHLVRDAFVDAFDAAVIVTNDTDLVEPMRVARFEANKHVILLSPIARRAPKDKRTGKRPRPSKSLRDAASAILHIHNNHLKQAQLPDVVLDSNGHEIRRPIDWS